MCCVNLRCELAVSCDWCGVLTSVRAIVRRQLLHRALSFAEIPDGRVSRLHCIVRSPAGGPGAAAPAHKPAELSAPAGTPRAPAGACAPPAPLHGAAAAEDAADADEAALESLLAELCRLDSRLAGAAAAYLEDFSSNGTFLNGERVPGGAAVALRDGDRLSLVLSVAPLTEQFFTFHQGAARGLGAVNPNILFPCRLRSWRMRWAAAGAVGRAAPGAILHLPPGCGARRVWGRRD